MSGSIINTYSIGNFRANVTSHFDGGDNLKVLITKIALSRMQDEKINLDDKSGHPCYNNREELGSHI